MSSPRPTSTEFDDFYERHLPSISAYARRRVLGDDAEDIVAQVFLVSWRHVTQILSLTPHNRPSGSPPPPLPGSGSSAGRVRFGAVALPVSFSPREFPAKGVRSGPIRPSMSRNEGRAPHLHHIRLSFCPATWLTLTFRQ